jgi:DNA-binding GntR family transcriptional regulator
MTKTKTNKLHVEPVSETRFSRTADVLRRAILNGDFKPGDRLIDRELCEQTGVGRSSIREALRQLEAEFLIECIPNRGAVVTDMTPKIAQEVYQLRLAIEGLGVRLFTANATDHLIGDLADAVDRYEITMKHGDLDDILKATSDFYDILFTGSGNDLAAQFSKILRAKMSYLRAMVTHRQSEAQRDMYIHTLRNIIAQIRTRDADASYAACQRHIEHASSIAVSMLFQAEV